MSTGVKRNIFIGIMLLGSAVYGQHKKLFPLTIHFQNQVGSRLLHLDSIYINIHDESFTVRNFRYYVSNISIEEDAGDHIYRTWLLPQTYLLIDERKPESKNISFQIPFQKIRTVNFSIGIDSLKNVSGVQTGALDPARGMFWTWNSGYIFAKLEGTSPQAKAPQNGFTYHIGGFRSGENALRKVTLRFRDPFRNTHNPEVLIIADINAWFNGVHPFKIADQPSVMTPGPQAMQVADNYSQMFSIAVPD